MAITIDGTNGLTTDNAALKLDGTTLTVDDTNNLVGIGTASPSYPLHINSASGLASVGFTGGAAGATSYRVMQGIVGVSNSGFSVYDLSSSAVRMAIDSSGNLLVGTTTGSARVYVKSDAATVDPMTVNNTNTTANSQYAIVFVRNNSTVGSIQTTNSATSYNTSSDYRLKENVAPMTGALATVAQLNPVTYTWKSDGSASQGFIAHELQAVVPDCVTGEKDAVDAEGNPVYQGVDTSFLVATLTAAIQELSAKNDALEARIAALEAQP